jgi:hypothetical protein
MKAVASGAADIENLTRPQLRTERRDDGFIPQLAGKVPYLLHGFALASQGAEKMGLGLGVNVFGNKLRHRR